MKISASDLKAEDIKIVSSSFAELQTRADLHQLFLIVINMLGLPASTKERYIQDIEWLYKNGYPRNYRYFLIKKASGRDRQIAAPEGALKLAQSLLSIILNSVFKPHQLSFGFRRHASIVQNAAIHVSQYYVFNIDLSDFFTSISLKKIKASLTTEPFNLSGVREPLAYQIAKICTIDIDQSLSSSKQKFVLPQGAPSSPILSNIVCKKLDTMLNSLAKRFNVNYSRYADDITFSANHNVFSDNSTFRLELKGIIEDEDFLINNNKTRLQRQTMRQEVTGLIVNTKINVKPAFLKSIRMYLHYWERYGITKAQSLYLKDRADPLTGFYGYSLALTLSGKLNYLRMVTGDTLVYQKLLFRYNKLIKKRTFLSPLITSVPSSPRELYFSIHKPEHVVQFLRQFQDSKGLKYLTHDYDIPGEEFNLEKIIDIASLEFNLAHRDEKITRSLYARIKQFAFETSPRWWRWQNARMITYNTGWNMPIIRQWADENPGIHPIRVKKFRDDMIIPFKESIQVRPPSLRHLLESCVREKFGDGITEWKIIYADLERAEFYTDVDVILGGIRHLLDGIYARKAQSNEVRLTFRKEIVGEAIMKVIELVHVGSICYKDAIIEDLLNGDFLEAKKAFHGLCNWSIKSIFSDGPFCLNILIDRENGPNKVALDVDMIEGFTHSIYFY